MTTIAALYIDPNGPYPALAKSIVPCTWSDNYHAHDTAVGPCACGAWHQLDCWDATRDARLYDGPHPIVAHPPCKHWGQLRHLAKVRCRNCCHDVLWRNDECPNCRSCAKPRSDADCAPRAVEQVRKWGGVLEHPAGSLLWEHCGLPIAYTNAELVRDAKFAYPPEIVRDVFGGYTIELEQVEWGHACSKPTWLYLVGVPREALEAPPFPGREPTHDMMGSRGRNAKANRNGRKEASAEIRRRTPPLFAEYLIRLARSARP